MTTEEISKGHIRVIHFSSNDSLPEKVRAKIPDAVAQDLFRQSFNAGITAGKSEMLSYAHAYKALSDAGYKQNAEQQWVQSSQGGGPAGVNIDVEVPIEKKFSKDEIETLAARVHSKWVQSMLDKGQKSRKSNKGEELMVPYYQLSDEQKEIDRNTVKTILEGVDKSSPATQQVHVNRPMGQDEQELDKGGPGSGPQPGKGGAGFIRHNGANKTASQSEKLFDDGKYAGHERAARELGYKNSGEAITAGNVRWAATGSGSLNLELNPNHSKAVENAKKVISENPGFKSYHIDANHAGSYVRGQTKSKSTEDPKEALRFINAQSTRKKDDPGTQDVDPSAIMYYADPPTIQNSHDYRNEDDDQQLYPNHMQQKDDPGTQDVDPPYQNYAAVPNYLQALPATAGQGTPGLVEKRISGGSQIGLNKKGEALAAKLGVRIADKGGLDVLYCSDLARGEQTAHEVAEANPHTVLAKPTKALRPWGLGSIEGKKSADVRDLIKYYIEHPDERPPGKGADGDEAETFNEATRRQLAFWKSVVDDFEADPTIKIGVICHGRGLDLFIAWVEAGCPDDFDVDDNELFNPDEIDHASMMRFHKDKIDEVDLDEDDPLKPGVYPILHSLTDDDNDEGNEDLKKGGPGSGPRAGNTLKDLQNLHDQLKNHPGRNSMASDTAISSFVRGVEGLGKRTESFVNSNAGALTGTGVKAKVREGHDSMWNAHHAYGNTEVLHADTALSNYHTALLGASKVFGSKWVGKSQLYLPPVEVHKAAKSAYDAGVSIIDITAPLSEGEGITETQVREIAKYFDSIEDSGATVSQTTRNAWGGFHAQKWVKRVLKKITAERVEAYPAWIGVDLDNTLAEPLDDYGKDSTKIGKPKEGPFFDAVKDAVKAGKPVRIFTARVAQDPTGKAEAAVKAWCKEYLGKELPVTHEKDPGLREFWDDKAHNPEDFKKSATRCMVCFDIPREIAEQIAVPGGEDPGDMHVTLAYLGKEVPVDALDKLKSTVEKFAAKFAPIKGTLSGPARFHSTTHSDGKDVCVALFSSVSMQDFRRNLVKVLEKAGFPVANNFSYTPHTTLKYVDPKAEMPTHRVDPTDVVFSRVSVWYGEDISSFPLSGTLIAKRLITGTIVEAMLVQNVTDLMQDKDSTIVWAHVSCLENGSQYGVFFDPKGKQVQLGDELSWENEQPSTCILGSLADGEITPGLPFFRLGGITDDYGSELSIEKRVISIAKETGSKQGSWVTVNGQHILIGPDGRPAGGNPRAYGRTVSAKVDRARKNAVLTGKHEQDIADRVEAKVAKAIGVPRTKNNSAFDLRNDEVGVEIKTMVTGKNDKITMGKSALGRKMAEMDAEGIKGYTVVADMRGRSQAKYYFSDRLGSLRIGTMQPMTLSEIKARINP